MTDVGALPGALTPLDALEAESIHIIREIVAECERPVMLYSIGKDSSVMLHLAQKAFAPSPLPFPLLHIDTTWKFREMIAHRDRVVREMSVQLLVHRNDEGLRAGATGWGAELTVLTEVDGEDFEGRDGEPGQDRLGCGAGQQRIPGVYPSRDALRFTGLR